MKLKQVSIFLENSPGRLYETTRALGDAGINLHALTLSGLDQKQAVMIFCFSDMDKAIEILKENNCTLLSAETFGMLENVD